MEQLRKLAPVFPSKIGIFNHETEFPPRLKSKNLQRSIRDRERRKENQRGEAHINLKVKGQPVSEPQIVNFCSPSSALTSLNYNRIMTLSSRFIPSSSRILSVGCGNYGIYRRKHRNL
ncbi:hypothetical protein MKW98_012255 [Papaver atlanticum]|uniref:Uncharacterized protein n=1 Tax=Papaver atlanticum TaxID=357466 RepID=A0AAD4XPM2_9MAGN|nr:hypothetical protein MKW98_012255 [Papaver atlanticum]